MNEDLGQFLSENIESMCCPRCGADLLLAEDDLACTRCAARFSVAEDIPRMFWPNDDWDTTREDVTSSIQAFYEKTPFPDYDEFDSVGSLVSKARQGMFAKLLDDQVPPGESAARRVLERKSQCLVHGPVQEPP